MMAARASSDSMQAGEQNSFELPIIPYEDFQKTLGQKIAQGDFGQIHEVLGTDGKRVYKIIDSKDFKNGDEIRISEIAGRLQVAPQFRQAFSIPFQRKLFVVIEMDHGGKTLGKHMEEVAAKNAGPEPEPEPDEAPDSFAHLPPAVIAMLKEIQANDPYKVTVIKQLPRASFEDTVTDIYAGKPETFYFQLFSRIKTLAEAKISYGDTHVGNILPNPEEVDGLKLIDFDGAALEDSVEEAKAKSLSSAYTVTHFDKFQALADLSEESRALIDWFVK
ncbi:hypothetical protein [Simkania sp.]|uniref:hypothetical protein n=1 Tax=Simkania sp. TaxID=34094 RepID=UPI003B527006